MSPRPSPRKRKRSAPGTKARSGATRGRNSERIPRTKLPKESNPRPPARGKVLSGATLRRAIAWAPLLVLFAENLVLFSRHYFAGAGFPWDFVGAYYAAPAFWTQAVQHGMFPQWMPYQWLGYPFFLNIQTSLFYPPLWLFPALHIPYTLHAAIVLQCLHVLAGSLGMYALLRVLLRSRREALIGAFAYQFFGGFFSNAEHVDIVRAFAFSPWLLYTLSIRRSDPAIPRRLLAAPLAMFAFVTGAYPGATLGAFAVGGVYPLLQAAFASAGKPGERRRSAIRVALAFAMLAIGIGMAAAAIGPPLLYRQEFARSNLGPPSQTTFRLAHFAGLVLINTGLPGDISMTSTFVGFLAVAAFFLIPWRALRAMGPVAGVALFAGLMAGGPANPFYRFVRGAFSLFGSSRFPIADYRGWIAVGLIACAASSLRSLRRRTLSRGRIISGLVVLVAFTGWAFPVAYATVGSSRSIAAAVAALVASVAAVLLWQARQGRPWKLAVAGLLAIIALDAARMYLPIRGVWMVPDEIGVCRTFCKPPAIMHDRGLIVAPEVLAGLNGPRPARLELGFDGYKASGYLLGTFNGRDNGNMLLESKRAIDAVPWTRRYMRAAWMPLLFDPALAARGRIPDPSARPESLVPGSVAQTYYGLDRITYDVRLPQPALFVENESFFTGWTARLSDRPETPAAIAINGGLRAWNLPAGRYRMEATFRLPRFTELVVLMAGCWFLWIAALALRFRFRGKEPRWPMRSPGPRNAAAALAVLWLGASALMLQRDWRNIFDYAPYEMPPAEMRRQAALIDRFSPHDAPIFYIMPALETWNSRMWKRALYPRPVFYVENPSETRSKWYLDLRRRLGIHYALSIGHPPFDPGFRWKKELPSLPASTDVAWFGEMP